MALFYISSSAPDLKDERRAVIDILAARQHTMLAMEHYKTFSEPSLEKCIKDVHKCTHYIGIFAFRYGSGITEKEYEAAIEKGLSCFIFLVAEGASWPTDRIDKDRSRIDTLRGRLMNSHGCREFRNIEELRFHVGEVITPANDITPTNKAPGWVPFLCNRSQQEVDIDAALTKARDEDRPCVFVLHGDEQQGHEQFRDRLTDRFLPKLLVPGTKTRLQSYHLKWPFGASTPEQFQRMLRRGLGERIGSADAAPADIQRVFSSSPVPVAIHSYYLIDRWSGEAGNAINQWIEFWKDWPSLLQDDQQQMLLVFLFIKFSNKGGRGIFQRLLKRNPSTQLKSHLENQSCFVVRPLEDVEEGEAQEWTRLDEVALYQSESDLIDGISELYREWKKLKGTDSIPMEDLAKELKILMDHPARARRAA